ncbi:hypothetical protein GGR57DRAFT_469348 [Xylariaceae sp. FL1272]|nr:hypothetical protein GGR57DRAFT_469348 [Xylariaceae sp. FL1272]
MRSSCRLITFLFFLLYYQNSDHTALHCPRAIMSSGTHVVRGRMPHRSSWHYIAYHPRRNSQDTTCVLNELTSTFLIQSI